MYYDNAAAADGSSASGVWDSRYQAVYHLHDDLNDSTSHGVDPSSSSTANAAGNFADGEHFDGSTSFINLGAGAQVDDLFAGGGTISAWVNLESFGEGGFGRILDKAGDVTPMPDGWSLSVDETDAIANQGRLIFEHGYSGQFGRWVTNDNSIDLNTWYHVAVVFDSNDPSAGPTILVNGGQYNVTEEVTPTGTLISDAAHDLAIGDNVATSSRSFHGVADEVRIARQALSDPEVELEYLSGIGNVTTFQGEETPASPIGVLAGDFDPDGDLLTATIVAGPMYAASFTLNPDGSFTYIHNGSENFADTFTYEISDGNGGVDQATVNIAINAIDEPPFAVTNTYTTTPGGTLSIAAAGLLANDIDPEGAPLSITSWTAASNGVLNVNPDGSFTYTHNGGATAFDSFDYTITDGTSFDTIAVNITISHLGYEPSSETLINHDDAAHPIGDSQHTQREDRFSESAVAVAADGSYVVVFTHEYADTTADVYFRRYDAAGNSLDNQQLVNDEFATDRQHSAAIAMQDNGDFIVTWVSENQDGTESSIYARQYNADGTEKAGAFRVNEEPTVRFFGQHNPDVSVNSSGQFAITWDGVGLGELQAAFVKSYNADGSLRWGPVRANDFSFGDVQRNAAVAIDGLGNVALAWEDGNEIIGRFYDATGVAGNEITPPQAPYILGLKNPSLSFNDSGVLGFAYQVLVPHPFLGGTHWEIGAQVFAPNNIVIVLNAEGNETFSGDQTDPSVSFNNDGTLLLTWQGEGNAGIGIYGRQFQTAVNQAGNTYADPLGAEFLINETTSGTQHAASVASLDAENFVVVWSGDGTGDSDGVFHRRYGNQVDTPPTISSIGNQVINEDTSTGALSFSVGDAATPVGSLTVSSFSSDQSLIPDGNLSLVDLGGGNWTIEATPLPNQNGGPATITVTVDDGTNTTDETFEVTVNAINDAPTVSTVGNQTIAEDTSTGQLAFTVSDIDTPIDSLFVSATSSDQGLIPDSSLTLVDLTGGNWTIDATPLQNQNGGPVTITVTVDDGTTQTDTSFEVTVNPTNDAPTISAIGDQTIAEDTSTGQLAFSVNDVESPVGSLIVTVTSNNQALIPDGNLTLVDHGGGNWAIEATPLINQNGGPVAITVTVDDGTTTTDETFTVTVTGANDPPTISAINDQMIDEDTSTGPLAFTVDDVETPVGSLAVIATSSDQALIPDGNLTLVDLGGGNWTVEATPLPDQNGGPVTITVTANDGATTTVETFTVTVNPLNDIPTVTPIADQTIAEDTSTGPLAFTAGDIDTGIGSLAVTATSSDQSLIPDANLALTDLGGGNWTIEATPPPNQSGGPVTITVAVNDGTDTTTETFDVTVLATNDPPTVSLTPSVPSLSEGADTSNPIAVATLTINDDGIGTNQLMLKGNDAALFRINGNAIELLPGVALDFETNPSLDVTLEVDDTTVGTTPDDMSPLSISIDNVNEAPTITVNQLVTEIVENTDTSTPIVVGTFSIADDALGTNIVLPVGLDAILFQVNGNRLELRPGVSLDFATNSTLDTGVAVNDVNIAGTPDDWIPLSITVTPSIAPPPPSQPPPDPPVDPGGPDGKSVPGAVTALPPTFGSSPTPQPPQSRPSRVVRPPADVTPRSTIDPLLANAIQLPAMPSVATVGWYERQLIGPSTVVARVIANVVSPLNTVDYGYMSHPGVLWQQLDGLEESLDSKNSFTVQFGSIGIASTGLTVGYVAWLLRGGALLSSLLASAPIWKFIDPVVIMVANCDDEEDQEADSLESIVSRDVSEQAEGGHVDIAEHSSQRSLDGQRDDRRDLADSTRHER